MDKVSHYISALKYQSVRFDLPSEVLESPMVIRVLKSINKNDPRHSVGFSIPTGYGVFH